METNQSNKKGKSSLHLRGSQISWGVCVSQVGVFGGDNRAGIDRTLHRISCIRNRDSTVVGLTCRVGRAVPGAAVMVADLVEQGRSILLLGLCLIVCLTVFVCVQHSQSLAPL